MRNPIYFGNTNKAARPYQEHGGILAGERLGFIDTPDQGNRHPEGSMWIEDFPFLLAQGQVVGTQEDMEAEQGHTRARQRDWQPGIPTGLGRNVPAR